MKIIKKRHENKVIKKTDDGNLHIKLTEYKQEGIDWLIITAIPENQFTAEINQKHTNCYFIIPY